MREPPAADMPIAYRDPGPTITAADSLAPHRGLDRCISTIVAAVMALHDCGERAHDITLALSAITKFGVPETIKRMEAGAKPE